MWRCWADRQQWPGGDGGRAGDGRGHCYNSCLKLLRLRADKGGNPDCHSHDTVTAHGWARFVRHC